MSKRNNYQKLLLLTLLFHFTFHLSAQWSSHQWQNMGNGISDVVKANGKVIFFGLPPNKNVEIYNTANDLWSSGQMTLPISWDVNMYPVAIGNEVCIPHYPGGSVDIYHVTENSWETHLLANERYGIAISNIDNLIFFAGGVKDQTYFQNIDIYHPDSHSWEMDTLSEARSILSYQTYQNKLFLAGGFNNSTFGFSNRLDLYDAISHSWYSKELSSYSDQFHIISMNGKTVIFGGLNPDYSASDKADIYNHSTGLWSVHTLSNPRYWNNNSVVRLTDTVILYDGVSADMYDGINDHWTSVYFSNSPICTANSNRPVITNDAVIFPRGNCGERADVFDRNTSSWSSQVLSARRELMTSASVKNKVILAGGDDPDEYFQLNNIDIYDIETKEWSAAHLTKPKEDMIPLVQGDQALFVAGNIPDPNGGIFNCSKLVEMYNATADSWDYFQLTQPGGCNVQANMLGNKAFIAGGTDLEFYNTNIDIYNFTTSSWDVAYLSDEHCCSHAEVLGNKLFFVGQNYVDIYTDNTTSTTTPVNLFPIQLFPNPTVGQLHINLPPDTILPLSLELSDMSGRPLRKTCIVSRNTDMDIATLPSGIYLLKMMGANGIFVEKVVKI